MVTTISTFKNAVDTDFSKQENIVKLQQAIEQAEKEVGKKYPAVINGERIFSADELVSKNPAQPSQVVGTVAKVNQQQAEQALQAALQAFEGWSKQTAQTRAAILQKAAEIVEEKRFELAATMIIESGKNYSEADSEVSEAIDFLNFYAQAALKLEQDTHDLLKLENEKNTLEYIALGVGFIIPPWNFPFAIATGLTVSAIVMGNTALLKPSSLTPVVAYKLVEILEAAGLPKGVVNFIPGDSAEIGDFLTGHAQTRFISFTGSKDVGLHINELAAKTAPGQKWIKRVNAEMGGKDGIVVDETADLNFVVEEIVQSAFSFQGQKCSAGSRLIIVESIYDELLEKVKERVSQLTFGEGKNNFEVGPVIDEKAYNSIQNFIEIGKKEGNLVLGGNVSSCEGYFIEPTIIEVNSSKDTIMQQEIFGPVLAVAKAKDWEEAIAIYNDTQYGLTGAFFSTNDDRIDAAHVQMHCGNLYINRRCTGALVGVHPFGGFNLSGTDSKAGSYDYLKLFSQGKLVTKRAYK